MLKQTVCVGLLWQILVPKVEIQSYMVTPGPWKMRNFSAANFHKWHCNNRIHALIKANICDTYGQDTRKIVSCGAVTNPD